MEIHLFLHHVPSFTCIFNGHFRNLNWRYLPYIRPMFQAYVREYPHNIWPYMVQYLHFRILDFPLIYPYHIVIYLDVILHHTYTSFSDKHKEILREMVRLSTAVLMLRRPAGSEKAADALAQQKALRDVPAGGAWVAKKRRNPYKIGISIYIYLHLSISIYLAIYLPI